MKTLQEALILLVDDNSKNLQILGHLLAKHYKTAFARDGQKALEFVKKLHPDLILLDVMMPGMSGFEVCAQLKSSPKTQNIPIIFLTAKTETEDMVKGFELGAADYVTKPFRKEELLARVQTHIRLKHAEDLLKQGFSEAQRLARMGSWIWDIQQNTLTCSDEAYQLFGLARHEFDVTTETFIAAVHPDDRAFVRQAVNQALSNQAPYNIEHRIVLPRAGERIVHERAEVIFNEVGDPIRMLGTIQDITERKQLESELKKLSRIIEESINFVFITDAEGTIEYVNPTFERFTGYTREEIIGQNPRVLNSGEASRYFYEDLWKTITSGQTWSGDFKNRKKNGEFYWVKGLISPIKNEKDQITHFLAIQEDISEKILAQQQAQYLATYDRTTGLLNREKFIEALNKYTSQGDSGILILTDVDGFKIINEVYGHNMADEFLMHLSKIIIKTIVELYGKNQAILGRLGEDEIAVAILGISGEKGWEIAEHIRKTVESVTFTDEAIRTTLSAGIIEFPKHGLTTQEVLSRVDAAVYRAKEPGKNRCHLFLPEDRDIENIHSRFRQKERIIRALENDRLTPWFQPILNLHDQQIHHYESLARMYDETGNIILPGSFIRPAEEIGLINAIDRRIIQQVIDYQAKYKQQGQNLSFTMNISGKHVGDEQFLDFLSTTIEQSGADPQKLIFEITETAAVRDLDQAIRFITALKEMGCRFALDDFGVGFTSFVYLKEMHVDFIKIDGFFIRKLHEHRYDQGIVRAMTTVAKEMKIKTIAEFVEHDETMRLLKPLGVDYAQGFLIGKPAPQPTFIRNYKDFS